jgi:hypothetical protein
VSARWVYNEEDDDSENHFLKFTEHKRKPPEYSKEKQTKENKPQRRQSKYEDDKED